MGFALFESSGTFNPASYGLVIGDTIQVVAVGGGKGGQGVSGSRSTDGSNGGASSFGSYVTAAGASANTAGNGCVFVVSSLQSACAIGNDGEHGWGSALWRMPAWTPGADPMAVQVFNAYGFAGKVTYRSGGATDKAHNGTCSSVFYSKEGKAGGRGGLGYGAGGGGGAYAYSTAGDSGNGGKAGTVKIADITLSSLSSIAVTVGTGGTGGSSGSGNYDSTGGAGANGCVAVFW